MGCCRYCGKPAGMLREEHKECREAYEYEREKRRESELIEGVTPIADMGAITESPYPDVLGMIPSVGARFEVGNIQYSGGISPSIVKAGEQSNLVLLLQNTLDAPVEVTVNLEVPEASPSHLETRESTSVRLGEAEVGALTIPILTSTETPGHKYNITFEIEAHALRKGHRIRPKIGGSNVAGRVLNNAVGTIARNAVGLGLLAGVGVGFVSIPRKSHRMEVTLKVIGEKPKVKDEKPIGEQRYWVKQRPTIWHTYEPLWTIPDVDRQQ